MNTVRPETLAAEEHVRRIWGTVRDRTYLFVEGDDLRSLQRGTDRVAGLLDRARRGGSIAASFSPSEIFPGPQRARQNLAAWRRFFNPERRGRIERALTESAAELGFAPQAFEPFLRALGQTELGPGGAPPIPPELASLLGVQRDRSGERYAALCPVREGTSYRPRRLHRRAAALGEVRVLDLELFSERLSELVTSTFFRLLVICGLGVLCILLVAFLEVTLPLVVLAPVAFSLLCTLGTLELAGLPLDIPGLLVAIVAVGMGIDYALFLVRSHQLFLDERHPSVVTIRSAIFLASISTLVGFGVLALADHALLRSAGLTSGLAIAFALIGAFGILPPVLRLIFSARHHRTAPAQPVPAPGSRAHLRRVMRRYRHLDPYARQFARFKMRLDPMFPRLAALVGEPRVLVDVGCGYGVPATWLAELHPSMRVFATDPDAARVRIARWTLGVQGTARIASATALDEAPEQADTALLLDVIQYLSDAELDAALRALRGRLLPGGRLVVRVVIPTGTRAPRERGLEQLRIRLRGYTMQYRTAEVLQSVLEAAGYALELVEPSAGDRQETWMVARAVEL
jgi:SAM-dependent methyltransferase